MSTTIDERIVGLEFDNASFEKNVKQSTDTLSKLDTDLNKIGNNTGLKSFGASANSLDLSGLITSVEAISNRFSLMGIIGMTAIENIANRVINTSLAMAKALVIQPVTTGLSEYELKMNNVQTTMVNTGASLEEVNQTLDELNAYADRTIYIFSDMTTAMGKFAAAGIDLETSKNAIMGISNAAAKAGANARQASSAMYNISQAYSLGYMGLIDWRSLELAGIASQDLKQVVIDTAVEMGKLKKNADGMVTTIEKGTEVTANGMRNTLNEKWFDVELMNEVFSKFSDTNTEFGREAMAAAQDIKTATQLWDTLKEAAQSGWAQNWQIIIGDYEEAKQLWKSINDVIAGENGFLTRFYETQQKVLTAWKEMGGRKAVIKSFSNSWKALLKIVSPLKDAFEWIFGKDPAQKLVDASNALENFTSKLAISDATMRKLEFTFAGVFSIFDIFGMALSAIVRVIADFVPGMQDVASEFLDCSKDIGTLLVSIRAYLKTNDTLYTKLKQVADFIVPKIVTIKNFVLDLFHGLEKITGIDFHIPKLQEILDVFDKIKGAIDAVKNALSPLKSAFTSVSSFISGVFGAVGSFAETVGTNISEAFSEHNLGIGKVTGLAGLGILVYKFFDDIVDKIKLGGQLIGKFGGPVAAFVDFLEGFGDAIEGFVTNVRTDILLKIAGAIGILAVSMLILSSIDTGKLALSGIALGGMIAGLMGILKTFQAMGKIGGLTGKMDGAVKTLLGVSSAVLVLSIAMRTLGKLTGDQLLNGLGAIFVLLIELMLFLKYVEVTSTKGLGSLIAVAGSVLILAGAIRLMGGMETLDIVKGLGAIAAILMMLTIFLKYASKFGSLGSVGAAASIVLIAGAVTILAVALKLLATIPTDDMAKAIIGMAASLMVMVVALGLLTKVHPGKLIAASAALLILSAGLLAMSIALKVFSSIDEASMTTGVIGLVGALAAMSLALAGLSYLDPLKLIGSAVALTILSGAMLILAAAITVFSTIPGDQISTGILGMATSLMILCLALGVLSFIGPGALLASSAAILIMSAAMLVLSSSLAVLGAIGFDGIMAGLIGMGGALAIFIIAANLMTPQLALNMILMAAGVAALGLGFMLLIPVFESFANLGIDGIIDSLVALGGSLGVFAGAATLIAPVEPMMLAVAAAFDLFAVGLLAVAESISIASNGFALFVDSVERLSNLKGSLTGVGAVIKESIDDMKLALKEAPDVLTEPARDIMLGFVEGVNQVDLDPAVDAMIDKIVNGLASASPRLTSTARSLSNSLDSGFRSINTYSIGTYFITGIINGLNNSSSNLYNTVKEVGRQMLITLKEELKIQSPSRETRKIGGYYMEGLAQGIERNEDSLENTIVKVAGYALDTLNDVVQNESSPIVPVIDLSGVYDDLYDVEDAEWTPVIRPILDPTNLKVAKDLTATIASNKADPAEKTDISESSKGASFNFTQNNYSPKALSRIEIYRQTRNQFSTLRGLVR